MINLSVRIHGLKKKLGPNQALDGLTTSFEAGHLHGIIGPDGAGKTTLMRHLMGLLKADQGDLQWLDGGKPVPLAQIRPTLAYAPDPEPL